MNTLPKTTMDTQNDGLEKVTPFQHGNFWYRHVRLLGCRNETKAIPKTSPVSGVFVQPVASWTVDDMSSEEW